MDPLSVTSGIVGIVAFALQLAKTASKAKRAIEEINSAPKEVRELIERLLMLETTCELIGFHLERRENLPDYSSSGSFGVISKALAQCLDRVQQLEQILSTLTSGGAPAQTPLSKFDTVSRLRFVLRKDKISSLVQEIDRVVSLLQFVIQVDMWTMTSMPSQPTSLVSKIQLMDKTPQLNRTLNTTVACSARSQSNVARGIRRPKNQQCRTFRYLGYITWTTIDGWTGDENDTVDHMTHRKGCITFQLPFTSTQLRMHYYGGMGTPSYALNVTHIIPAHSKLGLRLWALMQPGADPKELHELVSRRELSVYSIYRYHDQEYNLFFMAVAMRWAEGCRYLVQHDFCHKLEEVEAPSCMFWVEHRLSGKPCEVTETVLSRRPHDMRGKDIKYLLETGTDSEYFSRYLKIFLKSSGPDYADILSYAWTQLVSKMDSSLGLYYDLPAWIPSLRCLIEHGVDIHQPLDARHHSAYVGLLLGTVHPFEADERAYYWLESLKLCGVDLQSYIEAEIPLIEKFGISDHTCERPRKVVMLDFKGLPMPSWRWELATESNVVEVLEEFHNFGFDRMKNLVGFYNPSGPADLECWKAEKNNTQNACFPFSVSPIDCIGGMDDYRLNGPWCRETYSRMVEIRAKRFERREAKKWRKAHPGVKPASKTMPGSWVD